MFFYLKKPFHFLWYCYCLIKCVLMLPKEPGPGLEPYERISLSECNRAAGIGTDNN